MLRAVKSWLNATQMKMTPSISVESALILTHTTFCIPYVLINVKSRLIGMDPSLSEAARDLSLIHI